MGAIIIGIGIAVAAIGVVLAVNGLAIFQSTFGNALVTVGGIAFVGGLSIMALGFIHRALIQIADKLDTLAPFEPEDDVPADLVEAPAFEKPAFETASPSLPPVAAPVRREAPSREPPARELPAREPAVVEPPAPPRPRPAAPPPVAPPPVATPAPAAVAPLEPKEQPAPEAGLPAWFRRGRDAAPAPAPAPPPVATRDYREPLHAESLRGGERHEPEVGYGPTPSVREPEPAAFEPIIPRHEPVVRPVPERHTEISDHEPGAPPAFLRHPEPSPEPVEDDFDEPVIEPTPPAVTVLKSGMIGGMAYTLYSDGSIEADLPDGLLRFASLQDLREHVAGSQPPPKIDE